MLIGVLFPEILCSILVDIMESFDANKILPTIVSLKSVDNHLFRIGLSFNHYTNEESRKKRHFLYNPILINCVYFIQIIKSIVNLIVLDPKLVIWSGDFARALGIRIHYNIILILYSSMSLSSSLIWYYNYINGVKPEHLHLFQVMSGQIPPNNLGLNDREQIKSLIERTKLLVKIAYFNSICIASFGFVLVLGTMTEASLLEYLLFGIPNTIFFVTYLHYTIIHSLNQGFYCYITCVYIRNKIKRLNESLRRNETPFQSTFKSFELLYKEIDGYNRIFWSKYFLNFWIFWGSISVALLYCGVFGSLNLIYRLICFYAVFVFVLFFFFVILNASSVNCESKKSYKILNSLYVSYYSNQRKRIRGKRIHLRAFLIQLKVKFM